MSDPTERALALLALLHMWRLRRHSRDTYSAPAAWSRAALYWCFCLLVAIITTKALWQPDWAVARYDFLFLVALTLQVLFIALKLETWAEARVILIFHLTGTAMEWFKVDAGSWSYPEPAILKLMGVPLFSGFMYAAVGSYIARVIRLFDTEFTPFPPWPLHFGLAVAIYVNFFAHHFVMDIRAALMVATLLFYARTRIWFRIGDNWYWMPLPVAAFLSSLFLWVAENIGTLTGTWMYSGQNPLELVSFAKIGSWYLLLYVAFATVTLVVKDPIRHSPVAPKQRSPVPQSPKQPAQSPQPN